MSQPPNSLDIAVIGSGITGLSAAWLLSQSHRVTLYEQAERIGGHSHTVEAPGAHGAVPVDMGFIVYNEATYPNLVALFKHLDVPTKASDMTFAVSLNGLEYSGTDLNGLFAQRRNLLSPRFWRMLRDLVRFYRSAPAEMARQEADSVSLGDFLDARGYSKAFIEDHILPQAAAIWSTPPGQVRDYPAAAFLRFCDNHGLMRFTNRPIWRTVDGGSREYVRRLRSVLASGVQTNAAVRSVQRGEDGVQLRLLDGRTARHDRVLIATHADQALAMLASPSARETAVLGAFGYSRNLAVLHSDESLMPMRTAVWSSWNYVGSESAQLSVTYWMNKLQSIPGPQNYFVSLNPGEPPRRGKIISSEVFDHPVFDAGAIAAQRQLWALQGQGNVWFAGAHFGSGFHEDGLQAGLATAEEMGGVRRPWAVENESGRIFVSSAPRTAPAAA